MADVCTSQQNVTGIGQRSAWEDCQPQAALARGQSNRYQACQAAGVEPVFADYSGEDALAFAVSLNLHRRHLDESQRSICAAKAAKYKVGNPNWANLPNSDKGLTIRQAAEKFNVSERLVKTGKQVLNNGIPELTAKVESGQVRVSTAADIATLPVNEQDIIGGIWMNLSGQWQRQK